MTISVESTRVQHQGTGTPATGPYTFPFRIYADGQLRVSLVEDGDDTPLELNTDYTVSGAGLASGSITLIGGTTLDTTLDYIVIERNLTFVQATDLRSQGQYAPESVETALDKIVMQLLQLRTKTYTDEDDAPEACAANHLRVISVREAGNAEQLRICIQNATNGDYAWQTFLTGGV